MFLGSQSNFQGFDEPTQCIIQSDRLLPPPGKTLKHRFVIIGYSCCTVPICPAYLPLSVCLSACLHWHVSGWYQASLGTQRCIRERKSICSHCDPLSCLLCKVQGSRLACRNFGSSFMEGKGWACSTRSPQCLDVIRWGPSAASLKSSL